MTQADLAKATKVNQSTISRILANEPKRKGRALETICKYAGIEEDNAETSTTRSKKLVFDTFTKIWDGTDLHAETVARIIEALKTVRLQAHRGGGEVS